MNQREWPDDAALLREALAFLGMERGASAAQVRAGWKQKLKEAHPDMGGTNEATQRATNMRDVLLAWIDAGRPCLEEEPNSTSPQVRPRSFARDLAWLDTSQAWPGYSYEGFWTAAAAFGIAMLFCLLSAREQLVTSYYGLPRCAEMNIFEETKAMLDGRCWSRR
jgi:hypothetical protein